VDPQIARRLWHRLESLNAVSYFCQECRDAPTELGLRGFWMGYFANRAAPMGRVTPDVVEATFANFHPDRVRRALPDAWDLADPGVVLEARARAAGSALRRLVGGDADGLATAVLPALRQVIGEAVPIGRPLFAANRGVDAGPDPVEGLWQAATTLREHRGDGHVALLAGAGLDGIEAHVLFAAGTGTAPDLYLDSRGWAQDDWDAALERLTERGLTTPDGGATEAGHRTRDDIERRTDELAVEPYRILGDAGAETLLDALGPAADRVAGSGEIRFPNPMGLPPEEPAGR
jgi:hypothetical protein